MLPALLEEEPRGSAESAMADGRGREEEVERAPRRCAGFRSKCGSWRRQERRIEGWSEIAESPCRAQRADHFTGEGRTDGRNGRRTDDRTHFWREEGRAERRWNATRFSAKPPSELGRTSERRNERRENRLVADRIIGGGTDDRRRTRKDDLGAVAYLPCRKEGRKAPACEKSGYDIFRLRFLASRDS